MTVLTVGETMALLDSVEEGELRLGMRLALRFAGAESNFAIALARLGVDVAWVSRLGRDSFGDLIEAGLAHEGVDLRWVTRDAAATGLFCKWRSGGRTSVVLPTCGLCCLAAAPERRAGRGARGGAARAPDRDHDGDLGERARARAGLARRARERGACVLFDPNFRPALPDTPAAAAARQRAVLPYVDWYLCGETEAELLWPDGEIPVRTVIRVGGRGAIVDGVEVAPPRTVTVVDEVGAGDAFAAGFAYGLLQGWAPPACAHAGHVIAACALAGTGDWETLPCLAEVSELFAPAWEGKPRVPERRAT